MQIIKQCEELRSLGEHAEGYLCGLLEAERLEITYAYPSLRGETTDQEADGRLLNITCSYAIRNVIPDCEI